MGKTLTNLDYALYYASLGYKVLPCSPESKVPLSELVPTGSKGASLDPVVIHGWFEAYPSASIGIATGDYGGGVFLAVLDVDKKYVSNEDYEAYLTIEAPTCQTGGGGYHKFFKFSVPITNSVSIIAKGIDVRGIGGYVICAPSIHESGNAYQWNSAHPELPSINKLPNVPDHILMSLMVGRDKAASKAAIPTDNQGLVPIGGRNDYLMRHAGKLHRTGLSIEALEAAMLVENETKLEEPLSEREVTRIVRNIAKLVPGDPTATTGYDTPYNSPLKASNSSLQLFDTPDNGGATIKLSELTGEAITYLKDKDKVKGQTTHLEGLDKLLGGGKRLGEVSGWHAEAKTGKNTLWHYMMYLLLEEGIPQAYASRELSPAEEVVPNLMSVCFAENALLSDMSRERVELYQNKMSEWPLYFSSGYGYFSPRDIKEWVYENYEKGIRYFWFDHLHYMLEDPEDHKAASKLAKDIKSLAKTLNIHIDLIIQPNKLMDGQKLSLNSIKGGSAIGQAIDNLFILERVKEAENEDGTKGHISKLTLPIARSKLCKPGSLYLQYDPETNRFGETEPIKEQISYPKVPYVIENSGMNFPSVQQFQPFRQTF